MTLVIKLISILFLLVLSFGLPSRALALSISISNIPVSIDKDQETEIDLSFVCAGCGDSYIRGVFYSGGTNYFGFTKDNNGNLVGTVTDRSLYFLIAKEDLVEASWSGKIKIKPDSNDSAYIGPGEYFFKIGRYTSASDSSADWSNELVVKITGPTPTPSPTSTPTQTQTPTPTPITTIKPTTTPTKSPTPKPKETVVATQSATPTEQVLGIETSSPTPKEGKEEKKPFPFLAVGLIVIGLVFITFAVFSIIKSVKKSYTGGDEGKDS